MNAHIHFENVTVTYGTQTALADVSLEIPKGEIFAIIGPANSGKTTLLKCINRTIDFITSAKVHGQVLVGGEDIYRMRNVYELRRRVGMVFPLPVGLPLSVFENVAYAPRRAGIRDRGALDELVERCLRQAMLWDEVKDRLNTLGTKLSGGQQQRLTLARALSHQPEILCLDEFSIAIDPVTTMKIEDILRELKKGHDGRLGDKPRATGPPAGRSHRLPERFETDRGRQDGNDFHRGEKPPHRALRDRRFWIMITETMAPPTQYSIQTRGLNLWYGDFQALEDVTVSIKPRIITALIGPSGCGKTTLLRCFNRINERYENVTTKGQVTILEKNIYDPDVSLSELRKSVGDGVSTSPTRCRSRFTRTSCSAYACTPPRRAIQAGRTQWDGRIGPARRAIVGTMSKTCSARRPPASPWSSSRSCVSRGSCR